MSKQTAIYPFPAPPAEPTEPPPGGRRGWMALFLLSILMVSLAEYLAPAGHHYIHLLILIPILVALLMGPRITIILSAFSLGLTFAAGLAGEEPLHQFHLPTALGIFVAGVAGTWMAIAQREVLGTLRQREAEYRRDLSESLSLLRATLESTADGILVVDRQERVTSFNGRFAEIWGLSSDLLMQRRDEAMVKAVLIQLVDPESFMRRVRELYDHPMEESSDTLLFKDGRVVERYSRPQMIGERIVGRVWSFRDVTQSRKAEQSMEESLQRVDRLLSSSPAVLFSFRPEAPFEINYVSANAVDQLGYEPEPFLADPNFWKQLVVEADMKSRRDWMGRLLAAGSLSDVVQFRHGDGRLRALSIELRALPGQGNQPAEIVGSSIDVTERLEFEEERNRLRASLARSEAMSAIGGLVGGVAHEVRNPLFTISASLDAFEARFGARDEYKFYLGALRGSVERLSRLMNQLLDYGRTPLTKLEWTALHNCVERAIELLPAPLRDRGVVIENRIPETLPRFLLDCHLILQVFQNLIENAVQHSSSGDLVVVTAVPAPRNGHDGVECRVDDSGTGFNPGPISRIFEPFVSERHGGTGLGLSIVQRIVEQHGGQVEAGNRPEGGASIRIWLPTSSGSDGPGEPTDRGADESTSNPAG